MRIVLLRCALAATLLLTVTAAAAGPTRLQRDVDALRALGVTAALARLETTSGTTIATAGTPTSDPYLRIGSTTKAFVAVVVLQLCAEGRLSLDAPVPGVPARVTVRQLLQHTSGIHDYTQDLLPDYLTPDDYRRNRWRTYAPDELIGIAFQHPSTGTGWSYSNTNYLLLGRLIEQVTGHSWEHEVHARVLRPLGLRHTITPGTWPYLPQPHARNYLRFAPGAPLTDTTVAVRGLDSGADGSMISTASDVNAFLRALLGGRLLPPAQLAEMRTLVTVPDDQGYPSGSGDGLGIFYRPLPCGGGHWGHGGNGFGYSVFPGIDVERDRVLTVSVFTRTADPAENATWDAAIDTLVTHAFCD
ncbi:serine hydrolase domain-containing protein [Catenuloplanes atrovinosus]|uniref:D-alanyl-D-alanine carboxypeptidase n=1 Tax=Catenuloplanes atrovinosus TaxID=137266 RepID=A0AAE4CCM5_9ACTN|nr:serine hydrolase domain-containing protein [Catenuloplanes atrovinosus]MDR7276675.1 D-alanyl-D-alanine carboxypeptidase [Catenuloplanes atrovinosus]